VSRGMVQAGSHAYSLVLKLLVDRSWSYRLNSANIMGQEHSFGTMSSMSMIQVLYEMIMIFILPFRLSCPCTPGGDLAIPHHSHDPTLYDPHVTMSKPSRLRVLSSS
jgi:hypothetical protein